MPFHSSSPACRRSRRDLSLPQVDSCASEATTLARLRPSCALAKFVGDATTEVAQQDPVPARFTGGRRRVCRKGRVLPAAPGAGCCGPASLRRELVANRVTRKSRPSVVRAMAWSSHWRCICPRGGRSPLGTRPPSASAARTSAEPARDRRLDRCRDAPAGQTGPGGCGSAPIGSGLWVSRHGGRQRWRC